MQVLRLLASAVALLLASTAATPTDAIANQGEETKSISQLYQEAIKEGGKLVIYPGGDTPTQQDAVVNAFRAAFPKVNLTMIIDYSKYHNARIDNQLETDLLVPDIVAQQTLQDFPRWKRQEKLLNYKPAGFSKIFQGFVDPDGAWILHEVFTFRYFYDTAQLAASGLPVAKSTKDLADPVYTNRITSPYPHDDDAVLFVYAQYLEKYGWKWVGKMAANSIQFKRGSNTPGEAVVAKETPIGLSGSSPFGVATVKTVKGRGASSPYLAWGQRVAILKKAICPAAAKLFLNWVISKDVQTNVLGCINSRADVNVTGESQPWDVPEASVAKFPVWMEDRVNIERLKATMALYSGEVQGKPSPGELGLYPGL